MGFLGILFRFREKKSPDKLGLYPEAVHIDAMPERRYLWTSRILVIVGAISMSVTIMLACTVYLLLPQRGARPRLLQTNKFFSQLENSDPAEKKMPVMDLVTEQLIEKYIKLRHEIPESQSQLYNRWAMKSEFYWLSSVGVFQEFASKATSEQIIKFIKQGITRKVEMEWTRRVTGNLWQSQFHTIIRYPTFRIRSLSYGGLICGLTITTLIWKNATVWSKIPLDLKSPNIRSLMWELRKNPSAIWRRQRKSEKTIWLNKYPQTKSSAFLTRSAAVVVSVWTQLQQRHQSYVQFLPNLFSTNTQ